MHFFHQKSYMALSLNVRQNGPGINLFLALKGLSTRVVDNELIAVLDADAIASSIINNCLHQRQFTYILVDRSEKPATIVIDQTILDTLEYYPFSSIQELNRFTCIPIPHSIDTCRNHLSLG
jgi:hypothetical protein